MAGRKMSSQRRPIPPSFCHPFFCQLRSPCLPFSPSSSGQPVHAGDVGQVPPVRIGHRAPLLEVTAELALERLVQLPAGLGLLQQHVGQMGFGLTLHIGNLRQLLSPSDQQIGLLLARLAADLKRPPSLFGLVAVLGHLRERDLEFQLHLVCIGETAVAAGALFGEELRFDCDRRQAVVLLGTGLRPKKRISGLGFCWSS